MSTRALTTAPVRLLSTEPLAVVTASASAVQALLVTSVKCKRAKVKPERFVLGMEPATRPPKHANVTSDGLAFTVLRKVNASQRAGPRDRASLGFASVPLDFEERRAKRLCVPTTTERSVAATELATLPRMGSPNCPASATMDLPDRSAR